MFYARLKVYNFDATVESANTCKSRGGRAAHSSQILTLPVNIRNIQTRWRSQCAYSQSEDTKNTGGTRGWLPSGDIEEEPKWINER